ncbi:Pachytene checkpoint protein 2 [Phytophthora citrophthora]|uniref:Pachytene checkpoint protein 2 n=1 Tax=Phytophthora citrophthora TaxID=4793 RepID=A0AAD9GTH2_9STRA|nr:Pachytene checkpoint protein 2 [Phytophthora citrophthora]
MKVLRHVHGASVLVCLALNWLVNKTTWLLVEVCMRQESAADFAQVSAAVAEYLGATCSFFIKGIIVLPGDSPLNPHVECINVTEFDGEESEDVIGTGVPSSDAHLVMHVFKLSDEAPAEETTDDDENVATCQQTVLPSASFDGLWDSLIFDSEVKRNVLDYAMTAMLFSDSKVNPHIISWNRVVLLHGPPGTGKTSLCKALAHKLSIRLASRYPNAVLLEINAHSLFSKWFSESGKLVMKLFRQIQELVEDEESLICVLIDEVESLTAARKSAVSGSEPSDAIRVVNALLTQLDALKRHSNVLILTTSNITEAIDIAFVDRADIKQYVDFSNTTITGKGYIGLPSCHARYDILRSCIEELRRVRILQPTTQPLFAYQELMRRKASRKRVVDQMTSTSGTEDLELSMGLLQAAEMAEGFSGRALRKLPFQTHAFFIQSRTTTVSEFIDFLVQTIQREIQHKQQLTSA